MKVKNEITSYSVFIFTSILIYFVDLIFMFILHCRSRDRFVESSQQIEALVQRFARETPLPDVNQLGSGKVPLSYGKPSEIKVWGMLYLYVCILSLLSEKYSKLNNTEWISSGTIVSFIWLSDDENKSEIFLPCNSTENFYNFLAHRKLLAATFSCSHAGLKSLFLRLFALPVAMSIMWILYSDVSDNSRGFYSKSSMILKILGLAYGSGVWVTISLCKWSEVNERSQYLINISVTVTPSLVPPWRNRFSKEYDEGLYTGTTLLLAYESVSLPFSIISSALSVCILYP